MTGSSPQPSPGQHPAVPDLKQITIDSSLVYGLRALMARDDMTPRLLQQLVDISSSDLAQLLGEAPSLRMKSVSHRVGLLGKEYFDRFEAPAAGELLFTIKAGISLEQMLWDLKTLRQLQCQTEEHLLTRLLASDSALPFAPLKRPVTMHLIFGVTGSEGKNQALMSDFLRRERPELHFAPRYMSLIGLSLLDLHGIPNPLDQQVPLAPERSSSPLGRVELRDASGVLFRTPVFEERKHLIQHHGRDSDRCGSNAVRALAIKYP